jgi:cell division septation protein DedD
MRNVDRLQEQDPEQRRRSFASLLVLGTVLLGLFGAIFSQWNRASRASRAESFDAAHGETASSTGNDDELENSTRRKRAGSRETADIALTNAQPSALDPAKLTFERALTGHEDRPEVLAALEAAARRDERESAHDHVLGRKHNTGGTLTATRSGANTRTTASAVESPSSAAIPASLAASNAGQQLERSARHDKLVAAAMQKPGRGQMRASSGPDGGYLLHVISYDSKAPADALVNSLRNKGHEAFLAAGEVNGRGRYYRVRIGPFGSKPSADAYRHDFEAHERMNTIVVRRDE